MDRRGIRVVPSARTGMYVALFDSSGDLQNAVADADIAKDFVNQDFVREFDSQIRNANVVIVDANLSERTLSEIGKLCTATCWLEPTSVAKARSCVRAGLLKHVTVISPNEDELNGMIRELGDTSEDEDLEMKSKRLLKEMPSSSSVVVTLGGRGAAIVDNHGITYFDPGNVESVRNCTLLCSEHCYS